ncbi:LysR family transcriptional regulator [Lactococcus kimchii]|uniref:LysR family transcriptional regulator n=1 Tax=Lactococcus sp. S-13 TaxID=2507158 RepID=UPI0016814A99|nr:LysR family transcriptional regulator [Lactococcus sp. S-13]
MAGSVDLLHYLDTLLKVGNFTKAAQQLYISQPYLTQVIKRCEQELGVAIVNRASSPLQLTAAGELYYHHLKELELAQDDFKKQLYPFTLQNGQLLRIGILGTLGQDLLPRFLPEFLQEHPEVKVELVEDFADNNEKNAISGTIDFFIGQNSETVSQALKVESSVNFGYIAVIPQCSELYQVGQEFLLEEQFELSTFLQERLVLTSKGSSVRRNINFLFDKYSLIPQIVLETQNLLTAFHSAKAGLAGTIVPETMIKDEKVQNYNLFKLSQHLISANFFIAYQSDRRLSSLERDLVDLFLKRLA